MKLFLFLGVCFILSAFCQNDDPTAETEVTTTADEESTTTTDQSTVETTESKSSKFFCQKPLKIETQKIFTHWFITIGLIQTISLYSFSSFIRWTGYRESVCLWWWWRGGEGDQCYFGWRTPSWWETRGRGGNLFRRSTLNNKEEINDKNLIFYQRLENLKHFLNDSILYFGDKEWKLILPNKSKIFHFF